MRRSTFALVLTMLLVGSGSAHASTLECKPVKAEEFSRHVAETKPSALVFFASWCGGCVAHLKEANVGESLVVAVFDEKKAAEKALRSIFKEGGPACFFDEDGSIVKAYEVVGLPYTKKLSPPSGS